MVFSSRHQPPRTSHFTLVSRKASWKQQSQPFKPTPVSLTATKLIPRLKNLRWDSNKTLTIYLNYLRLHKCRSPPLSSRLPWSWKNGWHRDIGSSNPNWRQIKTIKPGFHWQKASSNKRKTPHQCPTTDERLIKYWEAISSVLSLMNRKWTENQPTSFSKKKYKISKVSTTSHPWSLEVLRN